MKKIYLSRHVDLGEDGYYPAGEHTLPAATVQKLESAAKKIGKGEVRLIEDLTPAESKQVAQSEAAKTETQKAEKETK